MSSEWKTVLLGDCVELDTGFPFKSAKYADSEDAVRLLRGDNIGQGQLRWDGVKRWTRREGDALEPYELRQNDLVLAMDRPWINAGLKFAKIRFSDLPALLVQRVARLRPKSGIDVDYLHSVLSSPDFTLYVQNVTTGTAVPHISGKQILEYRFALPEVSTQISVGKLLMSFDDRITLLRETNATLEAIAQALFKSWFVDFDPVRAKQAGRTPEGMDEATAALFPDAFEESELGLVPKGWRVGTVEDLCSTITNGGTPSRSKAELWEGGSIPWFKTGEFNDGFLLQPSERITPKALEVSAAKLLPENSVLMAIYAAPTVGRLGVLTEASTFNQACTGMVAKENLGSWFLFWTLYFGRDWFNSRANGAAQQNISKAIVSGYRVVIPSDSVLLAFNEIAASVHNRIRGNSEQAQTLATLRDTLLPRLISGQLRLPEAEALIEESAA